MDKAQMLSLIQKHYGYKNDSDFAAFLGIKPQVLSNWKTRKKFNIETIYTHCVDINPEWLITGEGDMLRPGINEFQYNTPELKEMALNEKMSRQENYKDEIIKILISNIKALENEITDLKQQLQQKEAARH